MTYRVTPYTAGRPSHGDSQQPGTRDDADRVAWELMRRADVEYVIVEEFEAGGGPPIYVYSVNRRWWP